MLFFVLLKCAIVVDIPKFDDLERQAMSSLRFEDTVPKRTIEGIRTGLSEKEEEEAAQERSIHWKHHVRDRRHLWNEDDVEDC